MLYGLTLQIIKVERFKFTSHKKMVLYFNVFLESFFIKMSRKRSFLLTGTLPIQSNSFLTARKFEFCQRSANKLLITGIFYIV